MLATLHPFAGEAALPPGQQATIREIVTPPGGAHIPLSDPPFPSPAPVWIGVGEDLAITEALPRPANDESEWIELVCVGNESVDLHALNLEDEAGTSAPLSGILQPGEIAVLASDTTALRARWSVPEHVAILSASPWPTLNHTAQEGAVAEVARIKLAEATIAEAAWNGGIEENKSWERVSLHRLGNDPANWQVSLDSKGATPGRPNSRDGDRFVSASAPAGSLIAFPTAFAPSRDGPALFVLKPRHVAESCEMSLFDSSGIFVRRLEPWTIESGEHRALWDGLDESGREAPLGLYIVRAQTPREAPFRATIVLLR
jgi:hypothetical protein